MTLRLALRYLGVFALVLAALSAGAYAFVGREYASLLLPALGTPEASAAYAAAMRRVAISILAFDVPLLIVVGAASWLLARASIEPLLAAQERERAFAADAAHALRSPLATIASVAQAARGEAGNDADAFDTIAGAAIDASRTVAELLTLARSADARALAKEPLDLAAVAADTSREFLQLAADRRIDLELQVRSVIVDADERRVRELLRNLLSNAVRHARASIQVSVSGTPHWAQLAVANDGETVADAERERIFERFYRANGRTEGSGLGLSIVRWIAQAHGGNVSVRKDSAGRTQFVVSFPAVRSEG